MAMIIVLPIVNAPTGYRHQTEDNDIARASRSHRKCRGFSPEDGTHAAVIYNALVHYTTRQSIGQGNDTGNAAVDARDAPETKEKQVLSIVHYVQRWWLTSHSLTQYSETSPSFI
jgi:hypothetical protein